MSPLMLATTLGAAGLLIPGDWYAAELDPRLEGGWLALQGDALVEVEVEQLATAGRIEVVPSASAELLLRHPALSAGAVQGEARGLELVPGEELEVSGARLRVEGWESISEDPMLGPDWRDYRVVLALGEEDEQTLLSYDAVGQEGLPSLLFAGDLDRDGSVDLVLDHSAWSEVELVVLHLSSLSTDEALTPAARVRHTRPGQEPPFVADGDSVCEEESC